MAALAPGSGLKGGGRVDIIIIRASGGEWGRTEEGLAALAPGSELKGGGRVDIS